MPSGTSQFWSCPQCRRHVPARLTKCRCGFSREGLHGVQLHAPGHKPTPSARRRTPHWGLLVAIPLAIALIYVVFQTRSGGGASDVPPPGTSASDAEHAESTATDPPPDVSSAHPPMAEAQPASAVPDAPDTPEDGLTPETLFDKVAGSVVAVQANRPDGVAQGSGVVVAAHTVVTNRHVVEGARQVRLLQGERTWAVTSVVLDATHDLARLDAPDLDLLAISVTSARALRIGERAYTIGAPQGLELTLSEGLVSGLRRFEWGEAIQTTAAISRGSSGGGLFDSQGQLIGITTFLFREGQNLNFALPAEWAAQIKGETLTVRSGWNPLPAVAVADQQSGQESQPDDSDLDQVREEGAQLFEERVRALAKKADELDTAWRRYRDACLSSYTASYAYGRDWFGVWDGVVVTPNEDLPSCRSLLSDILSLGTQISEGMTAADREARSNWVYPGVRREIRRRYYMDWRGWDR